MSKIVFFSIPAYGHTNPTIEVVRELCNRGNEVWYYSFDEFKEKIEGAGAKFISCDEYLPELKTNDEKRIGKDFSFLMEMVADTTIALDKKVCSELKKFKPDCIVSDSICFWGKLYAMKLNIPYICSTTTFAFNKYTAKMMKRGFGEVIYMIFGMRKVNKKINLLREHGYDIKNFISIIQNDNDTNTIVYTSKEFQPLSETFSDKYSFIGPSVKSINVAPKDENIKQLYISLGTVNNKNISFYRNCIKAFENSDIKVIMSVGKETNISELGNIPSNFEVKNTVNQIEILQNTDVFITHCGMNSVNESLYYGVPMLLFPQQSEQGAVAQRVSDLGAGIKLKKNRPEVIKEAVSIIINNKDYRNKAKEIGESFRKAGGAKKEADTILKIIESN